MSTQHLSAVQQGQSQQHDVHAEAYVGDVPAPDRGVPQQHVGNVPVPDCDRDLPLHRGGEVPVNHVDCQGGLNG